MRKVLSIYRPSRQRGIALVIVLWIVTLLSVMAASFAYSTRTETTLAAHAMNRARARALAEAGVNYAMLHLLSPTASRDWLIEGSAREWRFGGAELRIRVVGAGGLIDLNAGHRDLLKGLFVSAGVPDPEVDALLDAIEDWRDPDDLKRSNGAEAAEYRDAGRPEPKNAPFESVEELQQVLGMTRALYRQVAPALTVYSRQSGIDPAAAPPRVLQAVPGIDPGGIDEYVEQRTASLIQGTPPPELPALGAYLSRSRETTYHIAVEVLLDTGLGAVTEAIVTQRGRVGQPFQVFAWRESKL